MKTALLTIAVLAAGATLATFADEGSPEPAPKKSVVVGVFDSRAIAVVYAASEYQEKYLQGLKQRLDGATERKDVKKIERIRAEAKRRQTEFHLMAFASDSVKELFEPVADRLPEVAKKAGVDVIVSRWEMVHRDPSLKTVDVTRELAMLFDPDEKRLAIVDELKERKPLPREAVLMHEEK